MSNQNLKPKKKNEFSNDIIKGSVTGLILLIISTLFSALIIFKLMTDEKYYLPFMICCLVLSGFSAGFITTIKNKKKVIVNSLAAALLSALTAFIAASLATGSINIANISIPIIVLAASALGGIVTSNIKLKRKRR